MNIPGIKVLHQTEILDTSLNPTALTVMVFALMVAFLTLFLAWALTEYDLLPIVSFISFVVSFLALLGSLVFAIETPTGRYKYEVLIDDTTNLKTVYDQYEIVDTRGEIYVLKEKEMPPESSSNTDESSSVFCKECQASFDGKFNFCPQCGDRINYE